MAPLLVVDGDNLAHRAFHTTPKGTLDTDGQPINAIVGFLSILSRLWGQQQPLRGIFVAWDTLGTDTYRNSLWPKYQTGREFDPALVSQLDRFPALCQAFGFGVGKQAGCEADDLLASAACQEVAQGGDAVLYTADRDSFQLVSSRIRVLVPQRGGLPPLLVDEQEVVSMLGVLPEQVVAYKALAGDPSDGIPGAKGIGPKTAASLLLQHGTLEGVLANWGRTHEAELIRTFEKVVTIQRDVPTLLPAEPPNWREGAAVIRALGAENLATRLEAVQ